MELKVSTPCKRAKVPDLGKTQCHSHPDNLKWNTVFQVERKHVVLVLDLPYYWSKNNKIKLSFHADIMSWLLNFWRPSWRFSYEQKSLAFWKFSRSPSLWSMFCITMPDFLMLIWDCAVYLGFTKSGKMKNFYLEFFKLLYLIEFFSLLVLVYIVCV